MLPFGVTIPATVPQRSEIPEGLMNYPVLPFTYPTPISFFFFNLLTFTFTCNYLHIRYSHRPVSFYRSKGHRLVPTRFTIVPAGLDNPVPVRSEGGWSSVYEKQTRLPAQRNHRSLQRYTNSPERYTLCKSKYRNLC